MAKREHQPSSPSTADTETTSAKKMNRRDFVNAATKAAIPTIAFLGLARLGRSMSGPGPKAQDLPGKSSTQPNDCVLTCEGGCRGCEGECLGTCKDACFLTCEGSCKYTCGEGFCKAVCADSCNNNCTGTCRKEAW